MNNKMAKIHIYRQLYLQNKLSKQEEQRWNHGYREHVDGDTVILSMKEVIKNKHKTLNTSCQFFLACKVSFEKSADSLMGTAL